jgi:hypothetical protein
MFSWFKSYFGSTDRVAAAGERTAKAAEDIAGAFESARDQLFARLGIEAPVPVVALPAKADDEPKEPEAASGRGRGRAK